jgi:aldose sugar dehydrogenase
MRHVLFFLFSLCLASACAAQMPTGPVATEAARFRVVTVARGLEHPWGAAFLPDGRLLVTERPGRMRVLGLDGQVSPPLAGVPAVVTGGQGGLLGLALAPDFAVTREVYFCQSAQVEGGVLTRLLRAQLSADGTALEGVQPILDATPPQAQGRLQYGCRIAFGPLDGKLYLSTGDRFTDKMRAQRLDDLAGKVLRLERDGRPAIDNPFIGRADVRPEIFSYGHRNPDGLAFNPWTGSLWESEFGAQGGDEVNLILPGRNYGWPLATHGIDYNGSRIGQPTLPGTEEPLRHWEPSISPSGLAFYDGRTFPGWHGSAFLPCLSPPGLMRLTTQGDAVTGEERLLWRATRLRTVLQGPDGLLYLLTDEDDGKLLRLEPA